jgi:uncharacterized protein (TIGR02145 family)
MKTKTPIMFTSSERRLGNSRFSFLATNKQKPIYTLMKNYLYLLLAAGILFAGCKEDDPTGPIVGDPTPELSIAPASINALAAAGSYTLTVTSNVSWTASKTAEWLTISPAAGEGNGAINVDVAENPAMEARSATITVTAGALTETVTVAQEAPFLEVAPATVDAEAGDGSYPISITSNAAWTATSNATWITLNPASGSGDGTINLEVEGNPAMEARSATVTVAAGTLTETVTIAQAARSFYPASTQTWVIGDQTWSDVIHIPECNKEAFEGSNTNPQCRSYTHEGTTNYYYNWPYADQKASALCPLPWRVPSKEDFIALDIALGGDGEPRYDEDPAWITANYVNTWGGSYAGFANEGAMYSMGEDGHYWSSSSDEDTTAYHLYISLSGLVYPNVYGLSHGGFQVRCVK